MKSNVVTFHNFNVNMVNYDTVLLSLESESTVTGRCLVFLEKTMDEMDSLPEMKGHYVVTDNALIYTDKGIDELISN
ncbi:hypothetical protein HPULCUR_001065 [Helicostylum pulchrum]|uniref:Transposase n=1 Tax=Helicostylum pulchrum TaxID=562976 RepID=A0ABP9XLM6_9FUNG